MSFDKYYNTDIEEEGMKQLGKADEDRVFVRFK